MNSLFYLYIIIPKNADITIIRIGEGVAFFHFFIKAVIIISIANIIILKFILIYAQNIILMMIVILLPWI